MTWERGNSSGFNLCCLCSLVSMKNHNEAHIIFLQSPLILTTLVHPRKIPNPSLWSYSCHHSLYNPSEIRNSHSVHTDHLGCIHIQDRASASSVWNYRGCSEVWISLNLWSMNAPKGDTSARNNSVSSFKPTSPQVHQRPQRAVPPPLMKHPPYASPRDNPSYRTGAWGAHRLSK